MASGTSWHLLHRHDSQRYAWILDDGTVMDEPPLQESGSGRRIRLSGNPDCADYAKNVNSFMIVAAETAARQNGRQLWISLGQGGGNTLDNNRASTITTSTLDARSPSPHFLQGSNRYSQQETKLGWRFRHHKMPIEAQIEARVYKESYGWFVETKVIYPGTWTGDAFKPVYFTATTDNKWGALADSASGDLKANLRDWASKHPIDWCDGFDIGPTKYDSERQAVNAFAKVCRAIQDLEDIEIPNLLHVKDDGEKADKQIEMLSLRVYKTNFDQEFLDTLSDFLQGDTVVDQIRDKWLELSALFRKLGMVIEDPKDSDWWNFMVQGADVAPIEVKLNPVTDEDSEQSRSHSVMINLATGTVVVACSASSTRDEAAIAYDTALLKAELTGQRDHFLAFADKYIEERQDNAARQMMQTALKQAKTK